MMGSVLKTLRWSVSLGAKFGRVVPFCTASIVLLTLVSQMSKLLASFLPLKVVILLGSEGLPRYLPPFLAEMDKQELIIALSAATAAFFALHLLSEKLISWATGIAATQLLSRSHKMVLFENQDELAAGAYQRYSKTLAGGVFVALALFGLMILYPELALVILAYSVFILLTFLALYRLRASFRERLETRLAPTLILVGGIGFFLAFGYMVADFIFWHPPGVIIALVSLLLSRQLLNRASGMLSDLSTLQSQRLKLDALFFHGKVLLPQGSKDKQFWLLLLPGKRERWIRMVLRELLEKQPDDLKVEWQPLGVPDVAGFRVRADGIGYLLKLFDVNRSSLALHEATLMGESLSTLPGLALLGTTQVQHFHCLLYLLPDGSSPELGQVKNCTDTLREVLLAVEPPPVLVERYQRSKPYLWQRLDVSMLERSRVAVSEREQCSQIDKVVEKLPALRQALQALPLALMNTDAHPNAIWVVQNETPVLLNWGRWSLEPLGAGWPDKPNLLAQLGSAVGDASKVRSTLVGVSVEQAELAALAFSLERELNRQRFIQAIELLPKILERLDVSASGAKCAAND